MMICNRCGTRCPPSDSGLCFHCQVGHELQQAISQKAGKAITLAEAGIREGFPDWQKPKKRDKHRLR
jgi:hypothetical protein